MLPAEPSRPCRSLKRQSRTGQRGKKDDAAYVGEPPRRRLSLHQGDLPRYSRRRGGGERWKNPDSNGPLLRLPERLFHIDQTPGELFLIRRYPKLAKLFGLLHVSRCRDMKVSRDEIPLSLAGTIAEFVGLSGVAGIHIGFSNVPVHEAQHCISESKIRVQLNGLLIKWNTCGWPRSVCNLKTSAVGLEGL